MEGTGMSDEYGNDFITLTDEDGEEIELEHLDTAEFRGELYMAFLPADVDEDDDDYGLIILKVIGDEDDEYLASVDNEEELSAVHELFLSRLVDDDEDH